MIDYIRHSPPAHLAPWIDCVWTLRGRLDEQQRVLPDGCVELILHRGEPMVQDGGRQPRRLVAGQMDGCLLLEAPDPVDVVGVRFHPYGAAAFFATPMHLLTNRLLEPEAILGDGIARGVDSVKAVWRMLEERLRGAELPNRATALAVRAILAARGAISIECIGRQTGAGPRQLDRLFQHEVGIIPKTFARIIRFQNVFLAWDSRNWDRLTDLALECGFYDQAHLCHDFARFSGLSPSAFLRRPEVMARLFLRRG
jgi:AraC-like DNA-binding protein